MSLPTEMSWGLVPGVIGQTLERERAVIGGDADRVPDPVDPFILRSMERARYREPSAGVF